MQKTIFAPNVAIIHEWVDRTSYPESSGIIANDGEDMVRKTITIYY